MSFLLQDPTAILAVGGSGAVPDEVRSAVLSGVATTLDRVTTVDDARTAVAERAAVGCVLLADVGDAASVGAACDAIHEESANLPVLVYVESAGEAVVTDLASREYCRYLPRTAAPTAVRAAADDALESYERRRSEAAESSLFRSFFEQANVPIYAKDEAGRLLYQSRLTNGQDIVDDRGRTDIDLADQSDEAYAQRTYEDDMAVVETGEPIYEKAEQFGTGDEEYWSLTTKVPWRDDGTIQGLIGISFNVTEWKKRERQLAAQQRRVDRFASYLAHDMRTPIQIAYGALELAREGDLDSLDKVERAIERMASIVEDLGDLSSGDESSRTPSNDVYDVIGVDLPVTHLVSMIEELWEVYAEDGSSLELDLPGDSVVIARPGSTRPLLENLLKNAVHHCDPDVTLRVGTTGDRGFFVEDDGPGMPPELAEAVTNLRVTDPPESAGTGLLIAIEILEQLDWGITVTEGSNGGARFEFRNCALITGTPVTTRPNERVPLSETADVGSVPIPGETTYESASDSWRVVGSGENVWGDTHQFHFVYGTAAAPVRIQGRISSIDGVHEFSKAGLTVRAGLDPDAPFGCVGVTEDHGSEVIWRSSKDDYTSSDQFEERPLAFQWYRIDYVDGEITCYLSEGGDNWQPVGQRFVDLGEGVVLGMLVSSHDLEQTTEATFRDVRAWTLEAG